MDTKTKEDTENKIRKRPPSQMKRDRRRLREYRKHGKRKQEDIETNKITEEKCTQTETPEDKLKIDRSTQTEETEMKK